MKKTILLMLVMSVVFSFFGCSKVESGNEKNTEVSAAQLQEANAKSINIQTHDVVMQDDKNGTAEIIVEIPNYEKLYKTAYESSDPDTYLLEALQNGEYESLEYQIVAEVTIEDGKEIIHTEEAVKELLEKEMGKAINAMMEVE